jgi:hypothetical protein
MSRFSTSQNIEQGYIRDATAKSLRVSAVNGSVFAKAKDGTSIN